MLSFSTQKDKLLSSDEFLFILNEHRSDTKFCEKLSVLKTLIIAINKAKNAHAILNSYIF